MAHSFLQNRIPDVIANLVRERRSTFPNIDVSGIVGQIQRSKL